MTKLFIGGFPLDMTEMELVQLVSPFGTVDTIKIVRDKKSGECKGYAFLEMKGLADAESAMDALNGTAIKDRVLSLNIVAEKPATPKYSSSKNYGGSKPGFSRTTKPEGPMKPKRPRKQF
ncbi:MAG: recognition motif protein [Mucilaginibacter sp.]|nr:recognition motif protein [Mucilaginibacter sp.]MDB5139026.1 recognition motif protein [Mucilaginibacter sp.]